MTFTYSLTTPQSTKDRVRLLVQDTNAGAPLLQDEEITTLIALECGDSSGTVNVYRVAAQAADAIAAQCALQVDQAIGDVKVFLSQRSTAYQAMAKRFQARARRGGAVPYAGGISVTAKETVESDTDRVPPFFTRTMLDAPGTPAGAPPVELGDDLVTIAEV